MARSVSVRPASPSAGRSRRRGSTGEMHHHTDGNAAVEDRLTPHGHGATATAQHDLDDIRRRPRHHPFGLQPNLWFVLRPHESLGGGVRDHDSAVRDQHRMLPAAALLQEPPHHHAFRKPGVVEQPLLDLVGGAASEREHQRARILCPTRQVDHTEHVSGARFDDGSSGARQRGQRIGKVLAPQHQRRFAFRDRGSDPVGADGGFRVDEARCEIDAVEMCPERPLGNPPVEDVASTIGEDEPDARGRQVVDQRVEHRARRAHEQAVLLAVVGIRRRESLRGKPGRGGPAPRRPDVVADRRRRLAVVQQCVEGAAQHLWIGAPGVHPVPPRRDRCGSGT